MKEKILFSEKQRFNQWWIWLIVIVVISVRMLHLLQKGSKYNYNLQQYFTSIDIVTFIVPVLIVVFLLMNKTETHITYDRIEFRNFPFHFQYKSYPKKTIGLAYIKTYESNLKYSALGLHLSLFGKVASYNITSKQGIQLDFTDGSKLWIGTHKPEEAREALEKAGFKNTFSN